MRHLVACGECKKQYDATGMDVGSIFHCLCGAKVVVPPPRSHDAAVVRCSGCGAPRTKGSEKCPYCNAEFTLHEKDLHTICPGCMTRISDKARFCHNCGTPVVPEGKPGKETDFSCPVCGEEKKLRSRKLGQANVSIMECSSCGGLWLGSETFELMLEQARSSALPPKTMGGVSSPTAKSHRADQRPQKGPMYRRCSICKSMMNRMNYGRTSGVIIDICPQHGVWFDADELERLLHWIRSGGLALSEERKRILEKEARKEAAKRSAFSPSASRWDGAPGTGSGLLDAVAGLLSSIFTP